MIVFRIVDRSAPDVAVDGSLPTGQQANRLMRPIPVRSELRRRARHAAEELRARLV